MADYVDYNNLAEKLRKEGQTYVELAERFEGRELIFQQCFGGLKTVEKRYEISGIDLLGRNKVGYNSRQVRQPVDPFIEVLGFAEINDSSQCLIELIEDEKTQSRIKEYFQGQGNIGSENIRFLSQ